MTQEDKELLLKDLSARLFYNVIVNEDIQGDFTLVGLTKERALTTCEVEGKFNDFPIELIKPYLFPISSMTKEQKKEQGAHFTCIKYDMSFSICRYMEWCYKNHLDINGLIPKGLAKDATGLNIY